jgi:hypothetical protein
LPIAKFHFVSVSWRVVVHLDDFRVEMMDDFCHEEAVGKIPADVSTWMENVLFGPAHGEPIDPIV